MNKDRFAENQFIVLKDDKWLERQRYAGSVVAKCLYQARQMIEQKTPNLSLKDIEHECVKIIKDKDCYPTFLNYKGFPGAICASVNKQLVHGIPSNYKLKNGDIVKIDIGATFEGAIGDAAITVIYGDPILSKHTEMIEVCKKSLYLAISSIEVGKRLGIIGETIDKYVKSSGFKLIASYGGHGISYNTPHAQPFVSNRANKDSGVRIQPGMSITIEPMVTIGSDKTKVERDGWTVTTKDVSSHFEHSLFIREDSVEILTKLEN